VAVNNFFSCIRDKNQLYYCYTHCTADLLKRMILSEGGIISFLWILYE